MNFRIILFIVVCVIFYQCTNKRRSYKLSEIMISTDCSTIMHKVSGNPIYNQPEIYSLEKLEDSSNSKFYLKRNNYLIDITNEYKNLELIEKEKYNSNDSIEIGAFLKKFDLTIPGLVNLNNFLEFKVAEIGHRKFFSESLDTTSLMKGALLKIIFKEKILFQDTMYTTDLNEDKLRNQFLNMQLRRCDDNKTFILNGEIEVEQKYGEFTFNYSKYIFKVFR